MNTEHERELAEASNVLLLGSMLKDSTKEAHNALLSQDTAEKTDILALTFQSPDQWLRTWSDDPKTHQGRIGIISLDESPAESTERTDGVTAITANPADLTGIGMKLSDYLSNQVKTDTETVLCFDSITGLLQYTNQKSIFRFLRVITRRVEHVEGIGHFHLDPDAHDRQTISTIRSPFDAIVETGDADEETDVSTRY